MNAELLRATFRSHEYLAPNAEGVLAAVHDGIRARRRRRRGALTAGAVAAGTVVAVVVPLTLFGPGGSVSPAGGPGQEQPSSTATPTSTPAAPVTTASRPVRLVPAHYQKSSKHPFTVRLLPAGWRPGLVNSSTMIFAPANAKDPASPHGERILIQLQPRRVDPTARQVQRGGQVVWISTIRDPADPRLEAVLPRPNGDQLSLTLRQVRLSDPELARLALSVVVSRIATTAQG
jgi:hypothetical protein